MNDDRKVMQSTGIKRDLPQEQESGNNSASSDEHLPKR